MTMEGDVYVSHRKASGKEPEAFFVVLCLNTGQGEAAYVMASTQRWRTYRDGCVWPAGRPAATLFAQRLDDPSARRPAVRFPCRRGTDHCCDCRPVLLRAHDTGRGDAIGCLPVHQQPARLASTYLGTGP